MSLALVNARSSVTERSRTTSMVPDTVPTGPPSAARASHETLRVPAPDSSCREPLVGKTNPPSFDVKSAVAFFPASPRSHRMLCTDAAGPDVKSRSTNVPFF